MITHSFNRALYSLARLGVETTLFRITSNGKKKSFLKHCSPLRYKIVLTVLIARKDTKLQWKGDLVSKGGTMIFFLLKLFWFFFPLEVMQNSVVSTQIKSGQNIQIMVKKNMIIIKFSSILTKTGENCFYIVNFYIFLANFHCLRADILPSIFLS